MGRINHSESAVSIAQPRFSGRSYKTAQREVERTLH